jgi:hypothetical protein
MDLWNEERPISKVAGSIEIPVWIEADISPYQVAAIIQGGCSSGAYMPAVTYHAAIDTMGEHGAAIYDYLEGVLGELPKPSGADAESWAGSACFYVSCAVECWAMDAGNALSEIDTSEDN